MDMHKPQVLYKPTSLFLILIYLESAILFIMNIPYFVDLN